MKLTKTLYILLLFHIVHRFFMGIKYDYYNPMNNDKNPMTMTKKLGKQTLVKE